MNELRNTLDPNIAEAEKTAHNINKRLDFLRGQPDLTTALQVELNILEKTHDNRHAFLERKSIEESGLSEDEQAELNNFREKYKDIE
ncbi:hypothetical protein IPN35_00080 [Candidatus Peregrinibacteria bacterium]|nr:MAG: hypothetical protein IPN35_00080 [Candidatus Peregrinibacteria bacterium]